MKTKRARSSLRGLTVGAVLLVLAAGCATNGVSGSASGTCYRWDRFPSERFVLDIKDHSGLSAGQNALSVHGKHVGVCGAGTIAAVTGTIVTAASPLPATGAHMGLRTHSVRGTLDPGDAHVVFCKEVTLDCTSTTVSASPQSWTCIGRNEWDIIPGIGKALVHTLTQVNPSDPLCQVFQNGGTPFSPSAVPPGAYSGASGR
jgi:hypothetical protein